MAYVAIFGEQSPRLTRGESISVAYMVHAGASMTDNMIEENNTKCDHIYKDEVAACGVPYVPSREERCAALGIDPGDLLPDEECPSCGTALRFDIDDKPELCGCGCYGSRSEFLKEIG